MLTSGKYTIDGSRLIVHIVKVHYRCAEYSKCTLNLYHKNNNIVYELRKKYKLRTVATDKWRKIE